MSFPPILLYSFQTFPQTHPAWLPVENVRKHLHISSQRSFTYLLVVAHHFHSIICSLDPPEKKKKNQFCYSKWVFKINWYYFGLQALTGILLVRIMSKNAYHELGGKKKRLLLNQISYCVVWEIPHVVTSYKCFLPRRRTK